MRSSERMTCASTLLKVCLCMYGMCEDKRNQSQAKLRADTLDFSIAETARVHHAATTIQCAYRAHSARKAMARMLGAVLVLQRFARRVLLHIHSLTATYAFTFCFMCCVSS